MQRITTNLKTELRQNRNLVFVVFVFCMMAVLSFCATSNMQDSMAADATKFQPGNIISDAVMANSSAMSLQEIQNFLDSKNKCDNRDYNLYLQYTKAHPNIQWHWEGEPYNGHFVCLAQERFSDGVEIGYGQTAAEIIYGAAQEYRINPQVLIVLLQKESSLITDKVPNTHDYRQATGYGCPDTAACDSKYYGFKNQIYRAAELFRYTLDHGYSLYPEKRTVYVGYHPNSSCGGSQIYIENRATSALYRYTPYQPNGAAIAAGYGTGNACSAYGNRNFYLYFTDWFGSTQVKVEGEEIMIPDGEYSLVPKNSSKLSLGIVGINAQLDNVSNGDASQRWSIQRDGNAYKIINVSTNKVLDLPGNVTNDGTNVQIWENDGTCGQRWKLYRTKDNYLTLESACANGMVVSLGSSLANTGTNVQLSTANSTDAQKWTLRADRAIQDGIYTIKLDSVKDKAIDISGQFMDGANIQLWNSNHTAAQQWLFEYNTNDGYYTITNISSRRVLDISGVMRRGANIQLWYSNNTCAQRWQVIKTGSEHYAITSACSPGYAIDLSGSGTKNGENIQLWQYNATAAQQWRIALADSPMDGIYTIETKLAGDQVADLLGGGSRDGDNVQVWYSNDTAAQEWQLIRDQNKGYYTITNPKSGKVFDASGTLGSGTNVQTWSSNNHCAQKWYIAESSEGIYTLHTACNTSYALDVSGVAKTGDNIQLWPYNATTAQKWIFNKK